MLKWLYKNKEINTIKDLSDNKLEGFIYLLILKDGTKYIGKKNFYSTITKPPLKGKKRKRKITKESNWLTYCSSQKHIDKNNIQQKHILCLCETKRELTYKEVKYQFQFNVLEDKDFLNKNILGKFYRNNLF